MLNEDTKLTNTHSLNSKYPLYHDMVLLGNVYVDKVENYGSGTLTKMLNKYTKLFLFLKIPLEAL
jgi:hypothetical protein